MKKSPAQYFPIEKGLYEVAPGLCTFGTSFGNGDADSQVFQIDNEFARYHENKVACRTEKLDKYYLTHDYDPKAQAAVARFIAERLIQEHAELFVAGRTADGALVLDCKLTQEKLHFDSEMRLVHVENYSGPTTVFARPPYASAFDALSSQVQEDLCVMSSAGGDRNWLSAIHLCAAGHWSAAEKIAKTFAEIHQPVPGIEKINRAASSFVDAMINKGPYVRFVWGFATDTRLNHHPEPAPGWSLEDWRGRSFKSVADGSKFYLRVERQVIWGFPQVNASLFTIRVYYTDGDEIRSNPKQRELLRAGLLSMTPESRAYKGLSDSMEQVLAWLDGLNTAV